MRVGLRTCGCAVCAVCARCRGRREAPSGEACGSSRRGELRIPCGRRLDDASSESRRPVLEGVLWLTWCVLPWGRHGYAPELEVHDWVGLEIWCEDLSVFSQVKLECVTLPSSHGSHDLEGYAP
jgi:hypothetical protein